MDDGLVNCANCGNEIKLGNKCRCGWEYTENIKDMIRIESKEIKSIKRGKKKR